MPYTFLKHSLESTLSDDVIMNLSQLTRLTLQQENISKTIQNQMDRLTLAAMDDYRKLDDYYRKLELLQSEAIASSNNLSVNELETVTPTFLICNEKFHSNITQWVSCNARFVADGINNGIVFRFQQLPQRVGILVTKANENWNNFYQIANPLSKSTNTSDVPPGIGVAEWKDIQFSISKDMGQMNSLKTNSEQVLKLLNNKSAVWEILKVPLGSGIAYNDEFRKRIDLRLNDLNNSKNQLRQGVKDLSSKFEQVEFPVVGKVPVGLANAVIAFPSIIGVGSLICSYYLGQTISKRLVFHKIFKKLHPGYLFDRELYPVWVDALDPRLFQYGRLALFVLLPLLMLLLIIYITFSIQPAVSQKIGLSIFGIPENSVLSLAVAIGFMLTGLGVFIIVKESHEYRSFLKPKKN